MGICSDAVKRVGFLEYPRRTSARITTGSSGISAATETNPLAQKLWDRVFSTSLIAGVGAMTIPVRPTLQSHLRPSGVANHLDTAEFAVFAGRPQSSVHRKPPVAPPCNQCFDPKCGQNQRDGSSITQTAGSDTESAICICRSCRR